MLAALAVLVPEAHGVPLLVNYQGILHDSSGSIVADGTNYVITVTLYDAAQHGTVVFGPEEHPGVPVVGGVFSIIIGEETLGGAPSALFRDLDFVFLEIAVDDTNDSLPAEALSPRILISSVPYSYESLNAQTVGGLGAAEVEESDEIDADIAAHRACLLYTSPSPRDRTRSRMPSSA